MLAPTPTTEQAICQRCTLDFERPIPRRGFGRLYCNPCRRLINNEASRDSRNKRAASAPIPAPVVAAPVKLPGTWSDERTAALRRLVFENFTGSQLAEALGVTRNAAIAKASRLGLVVGGGRRPPNPDRQHGRTTAQRERRKAARADARPSGKATHRPALLQCEGYTDSAPDQSEFAVAFLDVRPGQCRYPIAPDGQPFMFCGAPASETYCPRHHRLCHRRGAAA